MKRVEKLAEAYYQERPEGFAEPRADFEAGYRAALEDAAKDVESRKSNVDFADDATLAYMAAAIRALADEESEAE
jgi:hypothetical protein